MASGGDQRKLSLRLSSPTKPSWAFLTCVQVHPFIHVSPTIISRPSSFSFLLLPSMVFRSIPLALFNPYPSQHASQALLHPFLSCKTSMPGSLLAPSRPPLFFLYPISAFIVYFHALLFLLLFSYLFIRISAFFFLFFVFWMCGRVGYKNVYTVS